MTETNNTQSSLSSRRSSRPTRTRKPKKSQLPKAYITLGVVIAIGLGLSFISETLALFWIIGLGFGFVLQKAKFCFTASMRDPYLTGSTSVTRAVLIAFAITTVGFTAIKYGYFIKGLPIPGMSYVVPISFATAAGAFIFGIGMVIAGGCASGTLMRVGEGFAMQVLSLIFFIIGSLWGAHDFGWWKLNVISKGKAVFLPDVFGWFGAVVIQLLLLAALYIAAEKWEHRNDEAL
ncbi:MAG: YeeE/YedE family protein [Peptostreptococcaceae bacterium]|nr:YeeE/YedE family protein [Peptostreptococcaceae bacterium]